MLMRLLRRLLQPRQKVHDVCSADVCLYLRSIGYRQESRLGKAMR